MSGQVQDYLDHMLAGEGGWHWPAQLADGTRIVPLADGVVVFEPLASQGDLLISSGIHGNETAPVELMAQWLWAILHGELSVGVRLLLVFGNPAALRRGLRYLDDDLNRLFGQTAAKGIEGQRAALLTALSEDFFTAASGLRWHYDLHTAIRGSCIEKFAIYPRLPDERFEPKMLAQLASYGIDAVVLQHKPTATFTDFSHRYCGAEAVTLELGRARPFGRNQQIDLLLLDRGMRGLIEGHAPKACASLPKLFEVGAEIIKHSERFSLHLADSIENFTQLPADYLVADDGDHRYLTTGDARHILFPNPNVKPGLRAGLLLRELNS